MEEISAQSSRLKQFIEHTGMTVSQFGKQCGFASASTLHNVIAVGKTPSQKVLEKIISRFPQLNYDWIILGFGEMIVKGFQKREVSADSLQKSTQASFGTIQQSLSDHDFSLNELAKSVEKAITRVDTMAQFVIQAAESSLEKQVLMEKLFFEKVDNKIKEIDDHVAQLFFALDKRDQETNALESKRIERLDMQRRKIQEKDSDKLFQEFNRLSSQTKQYLDDSTEKLHRELTEALQSGFESTKEKSNENTKKAMEALAKGLGTMQTHKKT
jgi:predicted transcriptional regulator